MPATGPREGATGRPRPVPARARGARGGRLPRTMRERNAAAGRTFIAHLWAGDRRTSVALGTMVAPTGAAARSSARACWDPAAGAHRDRLRVPRPVSGVPIRVLIDALAADGARRGPGGSP